MMTSSESLAVGLSMEAAPRNRRLSSARMSIAPLTAIGGDTKMNATMIAAMYSKILKMSNENVRVLAVAVAREMMATNAVAVLLPPLLVAENHDEEHVVAAADRPHGRADLGGHELPEGQLRAGCERADLLVSRR